MVLNYCPKCGSKLVANNSKCTNCGYDTAERNNLRQGSVEINDSNIENIAPRTSSVAGRVLFPFGDLIIQPFALPAITLIGL